MAYLNEKNTQAQGQGEQALPEEEFVPEQRTAGLPNSLIMSMPVPPPGLPNSVMREMLDEQIPGAKSGSVSAGMYSAADDTVRRERAGGRFSPSGEPHELVHSPFRQQAASERVNLSVSGDTVQREVDDPKPGGGFAEAAKRVLLMNRFKKRMLARIRKPGSDSGTETKAPDTSSPSGHKPDNLSPAPPVSSSPTGVTVPTDTNPAPAPLNPSLPPSGADKLSPAKHPKSSPRASEQSDDSAGSTMKPPVRTESFDSLYVMVDGGWKDAKATETEIKNQREQAERNRVTVSTTMSSPKDPNIPPDPDDANGEVVRDSKSGLWVEKVGPDLFVYIDGHWLAAITRAPAPSVDTHNADLTIGKPNREDEGTTGGSNADTGGQPVNQDGSQALPDETRVFGTGWRWRMSRTALTDEQINGMVAYYKDYALRHRNRVFATSPKIVAGPIQHGLEEADDAVSKATGGAHRGTESIASSVLPDAERSGMIDDMEEAPVPGVLDTGDYHSQGKGWKRSKDDTANAVAAQNVGMGINAFGRQGVLLNNYEYHVSSDAKDNLSAWDESKWKLPTSDSPSKDSDGNIVSQGDYDPYVNYVAPIAGTALGVYGSFTGAANMVHGIHDTIRARQNVEAGASRWDAAQAGLDTVAATSSTMSSIWGTVQSIGNIGSAATSTFGDAANAVPGLSIVTGAANAISGTSQAIRGRKTRSELNAAGEELAQIAAQQANDGSAPAPAPGQLTDQEKLEAIMKQGHQTAVYNMWSGGMKAASGGLTAAAGISALAGAAPVAAGIQGVTAVLNVARLIFERAYKSHMRNSIVGEEFDINWKQEMEDVRKMIKEHNKHLGVRDKDVREIILKAHGSTDATRTAAYNTIKLNRARYLINTATDANNEFHRVAEMVIEAMGVHKRGGNNYAAGADRLLAEKLG